MLGEAMTVPGAALLTRISKDEAQLGMFIHALEGPWMSHPFWRAKFLLSDPDDLEALRSSNVRAVVIDRSRGIGVPDEAGTAPDDPQPAAKAQRPRKPYWVRSSKPASFAEETARAGAIIRSGRAVAAAFLNSKDPVDAKIRRVVPTLDEIAASLNRNSATLISLARERDGAAAIEGKAVAVSALMLSLARQLGFEAKLQRDAGTVGFVQPLLGGGTAQAEESLEDYLRGRQRSADFLKQLKAKEQQLLSAMSDICDMYDRMTAVEGAQETWTPADAVAQLYRFKGQLDEQLLNAFIRSVGIYPVGSLVRLESERLAIVSGHNEEMLIRPRVHPFFSIRTGDWVAIEEVALAADADRIVSRESPRRWGFAELSREWVQVVTRGKRPTDSGRR